MTIRNLTVAIAASAALFGLAACGQADGSAEPTDWADQTSTHQPESPTEPTFPLPSTDRGGPIEQAYLETLADEGITLTDGAALDAANTVCDLSSQGAGLMTITQQTVTDTGLSQSDASYLYGAALITCGGAQ